MKKQSKDCATNIAQNSPAHRRQLDLFIHQGNLHKPQILSIPGVSLRERDRYRVLLGSEILGDRLTLDEALLLASVKTYLIFHENSPASCKKGPS